MLFNNHCRVCGCTDLRACAGGCYWVEADLCSRCATSRRRTTVNRTKYTKRPNLKRMARNTTMAAGTLRPDLVSQLAAFRQQIESDAEKSIAGFEANAGLLLHDLCAFLRLDDVQRAHVLGQAGSDISALLDAPCSNPGIRRRQNVHPN